MIEVGQVWRANVRGKVAVKAPNAARVEARVELTWVSSDGAVVEGRIAKPRGAVKVTLARCLLLELVEAAPTNTIPDPPFAGSPGAVRNQAAVRGANRGDSRRESEAGANGSTSKRSGGATPERRQGGRPEGEGGPAPVCTPLATSLSGIESGNDEGGDSHLTQQLEDTRRDLEAQLGLFAPKAKPKAPKKKGKRRRRKRTFDPPEGPPRDGDASPEEARLVPAIKLRPYQLEGAAWLAARLAAILADEPGLGKTAQLVAAIDDGAPTLVVCPSVARDGVWPTHVAWRPDLRHKIHKRRSDFRWPERGEVAISTYDGLPAWLDRNDLKGRGPLPGTVIIFDEAHLAKNPRAKRSRRAARAARAAREAGGRTWLVTGHPLKNHPRDLWALLVLAGLAEGTWRSEARFDREFGKDPLTGEWTGVVSPGVPAILRRVMLRREFLEVAPDMPPRQWERVQVGIPDSVADVADQVLEALAESGIDLAQATAATLKDAKRNKAAGEFMRARSLLAAAKVPALLELVEAHEDEADRPLVVFSAHLAPLKAVASRKGWELVTGGESPTRRAELADRFQAGELRGLAVTIGPVSTAISLSRARRAIFVDRGWTPSDNEQAEGRIYRADDQTLGTEEPVIYTDLVADHPIDRRLADLLADKREIAAASVGAASVKVGGLDPARPVEPSEKRPPRRDPREGEDLRGRRPARTPLEFWAEEALGKLAQGEVSNLERPFFLTLAEEIGRGLTDQQWRGLVRSCRRHVRIVGTPPSSSGAA